MRKQEKVVQSSDDKVTGLSPLFESEWDHDSQSSSASEESEDSSETSAEEVSPLMQSVLTLKGELLAAAENWPVGFNRHLNSEMTELAERVSKYELKYNPDALNEGPFTEQKTIISEFEKAKIEYTLSQFRRDLAVLQLDTTPIEAAEQRVGDLQQAIKSRYDDALQAINDAHESGNKIPKYRLKQLAAVREIEKFLKQIKGKLTEASEHDCSDSDCTAQQQLAGPAFTSTTQVFSQISDIFELRPQAKAAKDAKKQINRREEMRSMMAMMNALMADQGNGMMMSGGPGRGEPGLAQFLAEMGSNGPSPSGDDLDRDSAGPRRDGSDREDGCRLM